MKARRGPGKSDAKNIHRILIFRILDCVQSLLCANCCVLVFHFVELASRDQRSLARFLFNGLWCGQFQLADSITYAKLSDKQQSSSIGYIKVLVYLCLSIRIESF